MTNEPLILTVSELNREVRLLLDRGLGPLWVRGEITDLKIHQSGHVYFCMKDNNSRIRGIYFDGAVVAQRLQLQNGMDVEVLGRIRVYEPQGVYQISVEQMRPGGIGKLQQQFLELKQKLEAEGLFDRARKKPIPELPDCVGLITSVNGAAIRDFVNVVNRRFPNLHVRIIDARMQGADSAIQVIRAIRYLNREHACDVIVVTRGGGSIEDLWCFNEERLVRQVASSQIPVISAIGHEVDITLCDFAADLRAPTPSAAAELVAGRKAEYQNRLRNLRARMNHAIDLRHEYVQRRFERVRAGLQAGITQFLHDAGRRLAICREHYLMRQPKLMLQPYQQRLVESMEDLQYGMDNYLREQRERLRDLQTRLRLLSPDRQLQMAQRRLESVHDRLLAAGERRLQHEHERLATSTARLNALDPTQVLSRGYAILLDPKKSPVKSRDQVESGDAVKAILFDGDLDLEVK